LIVSSFLNLHNLSSVTGQSTFKFTGAKDWNDLPNELQADGLTLGSFKGKTLKYLQKQGKTQHKCRL